MRGVTARPHFDWLLMGLRLGAIALGLAMFLGQTAIPVAAAGNDRTLSFYHTHTGKTGKFTFRKNGKYDAAVLREMNIFLADWRTGTPTKMDPALFDLLWQGRRTGAREPYSIVSSYREPKTNAMLRANPRASPRTAAHDGKAMDVFIKGVSSPRCAPPPCATRSAASAINPSGSPFVHMDTAAYAPGRA